jgi:hypothetical protein
MSQFPRFIEYRNREFIQFLEDALNIYNAYNLTTLKLQSFVTSLISDLPLLNTVFETAKKNENTETLENLDLKRDNAIKGIRTIAEGFEMHYEIPYQNAGKLVKTHIDKYGKGISTLNYLAETKAINGVVSDFETDLDVKDSLTFLNLTDWVAELKNSNIDFNNTYLLRNKDISAQPDQNLKDLRMLIIPKLKLLFEKTASFYSAFETEDYKTILDEIDTLIIKYNASIPKSVPRVKVIPIV